MAGVDQGGHESIGRRDAPAVPGAHGVKRRSGYVMGELELAERRDDPVLEPAGGKAVPKGQGVPKAGAKK